MLTIPNQSFFSSTFSSWQPPLVKCPFSSFLSVFGIFAFNKFSVAVNHLWPSQRGGISVLRRKRIEREWGTWKQIWT